jgi:hypothetical protein
MVSVGTLSAFTMIAVPLLILRYLPPPEVWKAVIIQVLPDKGPPPSSVHISPSRPVFCQRQCHLLTYIVNFFGCIPANIAWQ